MLSGCADVEPAGAMLGCGGLCSSSWAGEVELCLARLGCFKAMCWCWWCCAMPADGCGVLERPRRRCGGGQAEGHRARRAAAQPAMALRAVGRVGPLVWQRCVCGLVLEGVERVPGACWAGRREGAAGAGLVPAPWLFFCTLVVFSACAVFVTGACVECGRRGSGPGGVRAERLRPAWLLPSP